MINFPGLEAYYSDLLNRIITDDISDVFIGLNESVRNGLFQYKDETTKERSDRFWKYYKQMLGNPSEKLVDLLYSFSDSLIVPADFDPRKILQDLKAGRSNKYIPKSVPKNFEFLLKHLAVMELIKRPDFPSKL